MAEVAYVNFYEAMSKNNYEFSGLTPEEYGDCMNEFRIRMNIKEGALQKQVSSLDVSIMLLTNSLIYLPLLGAKKDDIIMLKRLNVEINEDLQILVNNIQVRLNQLISKVKLINGEMPKLKQLFVITGQDMIAELSLGIELSLPMDLSLLDYVSYHRAAVKKNETFKKRNKKYKMAEEGKIRGDELLDEKALILFRELQHITEENIKAIEKLRETNIHLNNVTMKNGKDSIALQQKILANLREIDALRKQMINKELEGLSVSERADAKRKKNS